MRKFLLAALAATLIACGGSPAAPDTSNTTTSTTTTTPPTTTITPVATSETWTVESGVRLATTTSTSTVRLSNGSYRTYVVGIRSHLSTDGLTWGTGTTAVQQANGDFYRNPAIARMADGTWVLIFERYVNNISSFHRATSADGVTFSRSPSTAVMDAASGDSNFLSVPDIITVGSTMRMYFVAGGSLVDSATSTDGGVTWTREGRITMNGLSATNWIVDPDVIQTATGFRMYFATGPDGQSGLTNKRIRSAISTDGRTFTLEAGTRLSPTASGDDIVDPDVVLLPDGRYRMYYGYSTAGGQYQLLSATSSSGSALLFAKDR